jgi:hypothetical protein
MATLTAHPYLPTLSFRARVADRRAPALAKGERVLVSERDARTRRRVVATRHAVYYQDLASGLRSWHRLGWEQVERADWDAVRGELRLVSLVPREAPDLVLRAPGPGPLLDLARERVTATTLARVPLRHDGRVAGWLSARQPVEGDVAWVARFAPGVDPADVDVAAAIRSVRVHTGL